MRHPEEWIDPALSDEQANEAHAAMEGARSEEEAYEIWQAFGH